MQNLILLLNLICVLVQNPLLICCFIVCLFLFLVLDIQLFCCLVIYPLLFPIPDYLMFYQLIICSLLFLILNLLIICCLVGCPFWLHWQLFFCLIILLFLITEFQLFYCRFFKLGSSLLLWSSPFRIFKQSLLVEP